MQTDLTIDSIIENLFFAVPVIHKRLMQIDPPDLDCGLRLSRLHVGTLAMLYHETITVSDIASTFLIPKSQISRMIERMVEAGLVVRQVNPQDRRKNDIWLTPKGRRTFIQCDEYLKNHVRELLSGFTPSERQDLAESLEKLKELGAKFS